MALHYRVPVIIVPGRHAFKVLSIGTLNSGGKVKRIISPLIKAVAALKLMVYRDKAPAMYDEETTLADCIF